MAHSGLTPETEQLQIGQQTPTIGDEHEPPTKRQRIQEEIDPIEFNRDGTEVEPWDSGDDGLPPIAEGQDEGSDDFKLDVSDDENDAEPYDAFELKADAPEDELEVLDDFDADSSNDDDVQYVGMSEPVSSALEVGPNDSDHIDLVDADADAADSQDEVEQPEHLPHDELADIARDPAQMDAQATLLDYYSSKKNDETEAARLSIIEAITRSQDSQHALAQAGVDLNMLRQLLENAAQLSQPSSIIFTGGPDGDINMIELPETPARSLRTSPAAKASQPRAVQVEEKQSEKQPRRSKQKPRVHVGAETEMRVVSAKKPAAPQDAKKKTWVMIARSWPGRPLHNGEPLDSKWQPDPNYFIEDNRLKFRTHRPMSEAAGCTVSVSTESVKEKLSPHVFGQLKLIDDSLIASKVAKREPVAVRKGGVNRMHFNGTANDMEIGNRINGQMITAPPVTQAYLRLLTELRFSGFIGAPAYLFVEATTGNYLAYSIRFGQKMLRAAENYPVTADMLVEYMSKRKAVFAIPMDAGKTFQLRPARGFEKTAQVFVPRYHAIRFSRPFMGMVNACNEFGRDGGDMHSTILWLCSLDKTAGDVPL